MVFFSSYICLQVCDHFLCELGAAPDRIHNASFLLVPGHLLLGELISGMGTDDELTVAVLQGKVYTV